MEESKEFQSVVMIIETFEQELGKCDEREKEQQRKYEEVEREIEDHFAKCESTLAARKVFLLNECSNHLSTQNKEGKEVRQRLVESLDGCRELMRTGSLFYKANKATAEHVWKGAQSMEVTKAVLNDLQVDLSLHIIDSIQTHGKVFLKCLDQVTTSHTPDPAPPATPVVVTDPPSPPASAITITPPSTTTPASDHIATATPVLALDPNAAPIANPPLAPPPLLTLAASPGVVPSASTVYDPSHYQEYDYLFKMVLVGSSGDGYFPPSFPRTIGVDYNFDFIYWDTAGGRRFQKINSVYYKSAHGVMIFYDITCIKSFEDILTEHLQNFNQRNTTAAKLILGCKCDSTRREVSYQVAKEFADGAGIPLLEVSAKTGENVNEAFMQLATSILHSVRPPPSPPSPSTPPTPSKDCTLQ